MKLAERLSEPKVSCSLPISAFSIVPNFVVLLASWSGAEASRTHDLKGFRKGASLFSGLLKPEALPANAGFQKKGARGTLLGKACFASPRTSSLNPEFVRGGLPTG